jgi:hypothetical protein
LFTKVLSGQATITASNAKQFLESICDQESKALCINKLAGSPKGFDAVQQAIGSSISLDFLNNHVADFLEYLRAPEVGTICSGSVLQELLLKFVELTLTWDAFIEAFRTDSLTGEAAVAFSWLLLRLVSMPKEKAIRFGPIVQEERVRSRLLESRQQDVRLNGQRILHIVANSKAEHPALTTGPGGRHDNDHADIQKIEILPTSDELAAKEPYLPSAHEMSVRMTQPDGLALHIDAQFRLLREDMLRDLREEIQIARNQKKGRRKGLSIENLSVAGVRCDERNPWSVQLRCMEPLPQLPKKDEQSRRQFLKDNKNFLRHESVACLMANDEVATLGTLLRDEDLLAANPPVLCLQVPTMCTERTFRQIKFAKNIKLVQLSTAAFAYTHILKQLKEIKELSLEDDILRWNKGSGLPPPDYKISSELADLMESLKEDPSCDVSSVLRLPTEVTLDQNQAECFLAAISQRLSATQGPPGIISPGLSRHISEVANSEQERGSRSLAA